MNSKYCGIWKCTAHGGGIGSESVCMCALVAKDYKLALFFFFYLVYTQMDEASEAVELQTLTLNG